MSTAKIIKFTPRQPDGNKSGVKVADCENGYTRIANDLLEAILAIDLSKQQYKVLMAVIRKTYGFNKKTDRLTNSQISDLTGIAETRVCTAKNFLIDAKILLVVGREIGVNKVYSEWDLNIPQKGETLPNSGNKSFPKTGKNPSPKRGNTKDKRQPKDNITNGTSAHADEPDADGSEKQQSKKQLNSTTEKQKSNYQSVIDVFHQTLPDMPAVREITEQRKTKIRNFFSKYKFNLADWKGYLEYIGQNCRWMFESRPRHRGANDESRWRPKTFDFLLTERCYLGVVEGTYDDVR